MCRTHLWSAKGGRNGNQSSLELQQRSTETCLPCILVGPDPIRVAWRVLLRFRDARVYGVRRGISVSFMEIHQLDFEFIENPVASDCTMLKLKLLNKN